MVYLMTTTVVIIYLGLIQTVFEPIIGPLFGPYNEQAVAEVVPSSRLVYIKFRFNKVKICTCLLLIAEVQSFSSTDGSK